MFYLYFFSVLWLDFTYWNPIKKEDKPQKVYIVDDPAIAKKAKEEKEKKEKEDKEKEEKEKEEMQKEFDLLVKVK